MIFESINESFNYWNKRSKAEIERRAAEISGIIDSDPNADVISLNVEIEGLQEALQNKQEVEKQVEKQVDPETPDVRSLNPIAGFSIDATPVEAIVDAVDTPEYRNAFFKNLLGQTMTLKEKAVLRRVQQEKRDAFNSSSNTPSVLPTETLNEVVSKARKEGGLMGVARAFNIPSYISIPVGTPSSIAKWNGEGEDVDREQAEVDTVAFDGHEIIKVFSISNKVKTMSIPAFESYLTDELSNCVMNTLADGLVNGTGDNQGTGIIPGITWDSTNSFLAEYNNLKYTDVTKAVSMLKRGYCNGAVFVMNNATLYQNVYGIVDNNERPIFVIDPKEENIGMLLGFPVVIDDFMPDNTIIFGNPEYVGYNLPQGIAVESSTDSSFTSGKIDYRAMAIADCKPIIPEAFVKITINPFIEQERTMEVKLGSPTTPETVPGVSVEWSSNKNSVTATYTGLSFEPIDYEVEGVDSSLITADVGLEKFTLTFSGAVTGKFKVKAKVFKDTNKTVSEVEVTISHKSATIGTKGVMRIASND